MSAPEDRGQRRGKNLALALVLFGLALLFYLVTVVKLAGTTP